MKKYALTIGLLSLAMLTAGGKKAHEFSPEAQELLQDIRRFETSMPNAARLREMIPGGDEALKRLQQVVLGERKADEQDQMMLRKLKAAPPPSLATWRERAASLVDPKEAAYFTSLIDYFELNTLPEEQREAEAEQRLLDIDRQLKPFLNSKLADLLRLQGEVLSRLASFQPLQAIEHSMRGKQLSEQSLDLDPDNGQALFSLGLWYFYAPAIGGGDKRHAIKLLKKALDKEMSPSLQGQVYLYMAYAYDLLGERQQAGRALQSALEASPLSLPILQAERLYQKDLALSPFTIG